MKRRIIEINETLCNGCGACANACHEGAIQMINGKATLIRDDYCDGLGDCLPVCPTDAIRFVEREAAAYDEAAVKANQAVEASQQSNLPNWPVQLKLLPVNAPYLANAHLLIAADCTAYAYAAFHKTFMTNRITIIACPKLDAIDYAEKLTALLMANDPQSITLVRMQVPCCGGLEMAIQKALKQSQKEIPIQVVTISTKGAIIT